MKSYKFNFLIAILFFLGSNSALACGCPESFNLSLKQRVLAAFDGATTVFSGKVIEFDHRKDAVSLRNSKEQTAQTDPLRRYAIFEIDQWWKSPTQSILDLRTDFFKNPNGSFSFNSCDYPFKLGESYLVFAYKDKYGLRTNSCTRTASLADSVKALEVIGPGTAPVKPKI